MMTSTEVVLIILYIFILLANFIIRRKNKEIEELYKKVETLTIEKLVLSKELKKEKAKWNILKNQ